MPIGTSDGQHFEDEFHQAVVQQQQQSMTHQAEQPNPAVPIIDTAGKFWHGGLSETLPNAGIPKAGDVLHSDSANTALQAMPALGIFGGRYTPFAKSFAEALEAKGHGATTIKNWSGLERGAEGMWRKEISDVAAKSDFDTNKMLPSTWESGDKFHISTVGDVLQHDKLYKVYPEAKNIPVIVDPSLSVHGLYSSSDGAIRIKGGLKPEQQHSTLLHELQHWVQDKEGFHFDTPGSIGDVYKNPTDVIPMNKSEVYDKLATEVEARNVQKRARPFLIPPELGKASETSMRTLRPLSREDQIIGASRPGRGY